MRHVSAQDAWTRVHGDAEFAFLDVREIVPFGRGHPFLAANLPWSRLELAIGARVPRRDTPILLCDRAGELAPRAAARLGELGYTDVCVLDGGADGWAAAGFALFEEIEVPAKGFGAFARETGRPAFISPRALADALASGEDWVVFDSRPMQEYRRGNIPGSIDAPGAELLRCFDDLVPDPRTKVVVNCMSATRGILGGLSLTLAEVPNEVFVLHHGTRGWLLDGLALETGASRVPDPPSAAAVAAARRRAARLRAWAGIRCVDAAALQRLRADPGRTTFLFDVRSRGEFEAGHIAGARNVPEGRLVMSPEEFFATRNAVIVLADDDTARATVTALWLAQMGFGDVRVADDDGFALETGPEADPAAAALETLAAAHDPQPLSARVLDKRLRIVNREERPQVIDVGTSGAFCDAHLPGARWVPRAALPAFLDTLGPEPDLVLTSEDGDTARLAAIDCLADGIAGAAFLDGGTAAWRAAGLPLENGPGGLEAERVDTWLASSERPGDVTANVVAYLEWETRLTERIEAAGESPYRNLVWPR